MSKGCSNSLSKEIQDMLPVCHEEECENLATNVVIDMRGRVTELGARMCSYCNEHAEKEGMKIISRVIL